MNVPTSPQTHRIPHPPAGNTRTGGSWALTPNPTERSDMAGNAQIASIMRAEIERVLAQDPNADHVERRLSPFLTVRAVRTTSANAPLSVVVGKPESAVTTGGLDAKNAPDVNGEPIQTIILPNAELTAHATGLVGLEPQIADMTLNLKLKLQGGLDAWAEKLGTPVPAPLRQHLESSSAALLVTGPPGVGKTPVLLQVANRFSIEQGISGIVLIADTKLRGPHVGESSERLRRFVAAARNQPYGFRALLFDELEVLSAKRSLTDSHLEDKALTVQFMRMLDEIAVEPMTCVLAASNCPDMIDPAVRRRATEYVIERPDRAVRQALLQQWFPDASPRECTRLVAASDGMTPAGIQRALATYYRSLMLIGQCPDLRDVATKLRRTPRTKDV